MTSAISQAPSAATAIAPPVPKPADYSIVEIVLTFFKERAKDIAKSGAYLSFWLTQAIPDLPPNVTKFNFMLRDFKNFISATEVPEKLYTFGTSLTSLATAAADKTAAAAHKLFKDTMSLINVSADTLDFANIFIPLGKETMRWISGINFAATFGFATNGAIEQIQTINGMQKIDEKRTMFALINLARDVSYVALGAIGLVSVITATPLAPWMIVALLTSGLTFSLSSYFYEKTVDPENKGKNLNPAVVVENYVNQRNYEHRLA